MKRVVLAIFLVATLATVVACGSGIESIGELRPVLVYPSSTVGQVNLPKQVTVTYSDGSTALMDVAWETSKLPETLTTDIEVIGKVKGTSLPVRVQLDVRKPTADDDEFWLDPPLPLLTNEELNGSKLAMIMEDKALSMNWTKEMALAWSPDQQTLAYITAQSFWVWPLGEKQPTKVEQVGDAGYGGLGHPAWSYDGKYLSVHLGFSSEMDLLVFDPSNLKLVRKLKMYGLGFWAPESDCILYACDSGIQQASIFTIDHTTDLALFAMDTGEKQMLLKADAKTLYSAVGWAGPRQVRYNRNVDGRYEENLQLSVGP